MVVCVTLHIFFTLFSSNIHPLEAVPRSRELRVSENYSDLSNWRSAISFFQKTAIKHIFYIQNMLS